MSHIIIILLGIPILTGLYVGGLGLAHTINRSLANLQNVPEQYANESWISLFVWNWRLNYQEKKNAIVIGESMEAPHARKKGDPKQTSFLIDPSEKDLS